MIRRVMAIIPLQQQQPATVASSIAATATATVSTVVAPTKGTFPLTQRYQTHFYTIYNKHRQKKYSWFFTNRFSLFLYCFCCCSPELFDHFNFISRFDFSPVFCFLCVLIPDLSFSLAFFFCSSLLISFHFSFSFSFNCPLFRWLFLLWNFFLFMIQIN